MDQWIFNILCQIGILITAIAFLVGTYFALLAVSAYSHIKDIEATKKTVEKESTDLTTRMEKLQGHFEIVYKDGLNIAQEMSNILDNFISHQIYVDDVNLPQKQEDYEKYLLRRRTYLLRMRSRIALEYPYLNTLRRINLIREMLAFADSSDFELLNKSYLNSNEPGEIRDLAKNILDQLKNKGMH